MPPLYHYCSTETFTSIISSASIRLSLLTLSNDSLEGRVILDVFRRLSQKENLSEEVQEWLIGAVDAVEYFYPGLGFCLSENGDLLSQWRGYADDAFGLSIGFSRQKLKSYINSICVEKAEYFLRKVIYREKEQEEAVIEEYTSMKKLAKDLERPKFGRLSSLVIPQPQIERQNRYREGVEKLHHSAIQQLSGIYFLKDIAFEEEREWRITTRLHYRHQACAKFRAVRDRIIPFETLSFGKAKADLIEKIIIGPKNTTPVMVIQKLLKSHGFKDVEVTRSKIPYK